MRGRLLGMKMRSLISGWNSGCSGSSGWRSSGCWGGSRGSCRRLMIIVIVVTNVNIVESGTIVMVMNVDIVHLMMVVVMVMMVMVMLQG